MVDRIESCVRAVDRMEERQHVDTAEDACQRAVEDRLQVAKRSARESIDVGDQLRAIVHRLAYSGMAPCRRCVRRGVDELLRAADVVKLNERGLRFVHEHFDLPAGPEELCRGRANTDRKLIGIQ
jgi:hypothetical protein